MKIVELFRRLSFGELSNLSIANGGQGQLAEEKHPQMIQYTNEGLLQIYSRFLLKEKNLILEQSEHVINYHLMREYSVSSNSAEVRHRYIVDCAESPFTEDVIKILAVYDTYGCQLPLNDLENPKSLFTPQPNTLQIGTPVDGIQLALMYQARHRVLHDTPDTIMEQEITLPFFLEGALQNFVGYKTYSHMNGRENIIKGNEYLAAYEATCVNVEQRDLVNQSFHTSHSKLEQRGFV